MYLKYLQTYVYLLGQKTMNVQTLINVSSPESILPPSIVGFSFLFSNFGSASFFSLSQATSPVLASSFSCRRFRAAEPWESCSPIVYSEVARRGQEQEEEVIVSEEKRSSNPEYLTLVRVEEEEEETEEVGPGQAGITFSCLSRTEKSREMEELEPEEEEEDSFSRLGLSDLSCRLGGTGLYISRDNGLDITDRLGDDTEGEKRDSRFFILLNL